MLYSCLEHCIESKLKICVVSDTGSENVSYLIGKRVTLQLYQTRNVGEGHEGVGEFSFVAFSKVDTQTNRSRDRTAHHGTADVYHDEEVVFPFDVVRQCLPLFLKNIVFHDSLFIDEVADSVREHVLLNDVVRIQGRRIDLRFSVLHVFQIRSEVFSVVSEECRTVFLHGVRRNCIVLDAAVIRVCQTYFRDIQVCTKSRECLTVFPFSHTQLCRQITSDHLCLVGGGIH